MFVEFERHKSKEHNVRQISFKYGRLNFCQAKTSVIVPIPWFIRLFVLRRLFLVVLCET